MHAAMSSAASVCVCGCVCSCVCAREGQEKKREAGSKRTEFSPVVQLSPPIRIKPEAAESWCHGWPLQDQTCHFSYRSVQVEAQAHAHISTSLCHYPSVLFYFPTHVPPVSVRVCFEAKRVLWGFFDKLKKTGKPVEATWSYDSDTFTKEVAAKEINTLTALIHLSLTSAANYRVFWLKTFFPELRTVINTVKSGYSCAAVFRLKRRWYSHFYLTRHFTRAALNSSVATESLCLEVSSRGLSVMLLEDISRLCCVDERVWYISATGPPTLHSPRGGMRAWRWKETEIRGWNKLTSFSSSRK